jgi:hypothetical protein
MKADFEFTALVESERAWSFIRMKDSRGCDLVDGEFGDETGDRSMERRRISSVKFL